jgi:hypothetical protein
MGLVRPLSDGRYALGPYDPIDELAREAFLDLLLIEGVLGQCHGNSDSSAVRRRLASSDETDIV